MTQTTRTEWLGPEFRSPAQRIVSLVPSLTAALFQLGVGGRLVGRTDFCVRPTGLVEAIPVVGGTKNADPERVLALSPDVVLANREENSPQRVTAMAARCPVWLSDPHSPRDVPTLWRELGAIVDRPESEALALALTSRLERLDSRVVGRRPRVLYLVWKEPWMVAGADTYIGALLEIAGFDNAAPVDAGRGRYPTLERDELLVLAADAYLFSTEPYPFRLPADLGPLADRVTGRLSEGGLRLRGGAVAVEVDGMAFGWYPSKTLDGLDAACRLRARLLSEREKTPRLLRV